MIIDCPACEGFGGEEMDGLLGGEHAFVDCIPCDGKGELVVHGPELTEARPAMSGLDESIAALSSGHVHGARVSELTDRISMEAGKRDWELYGELMIQVLKAIAERRAPVPASIARAVLKPSQEETTPKGES